MAIIYVSFFINIVVAGFWGIVLFRNKLPNLSAVFGSDSPGIRILASLYSAIAIVSIFAIISPTYIVSIACMLFPLQIIYKILSVFSVNDLRNPVVISNIGIAFFHGISLYILHLHLVF
jgi:hypothetical protein